MGERYKDYSDLADTLREYSRVRSGELAELTYKAALTIDTLIGRLKVLESKIEQMEGEE
jgi:hypothetical protein